MPTKTIDGVRTQTGRIYVINHPHGYVKIGESSKPTERLSGIQIGSPYHLTLYTLIDVVGNSETVEKAIHEAYQDDHIRGEWFDLTEREKTPLSKIDVIYESVVNNVEEWSPMKHLELPNQDREYMRQSKLETVVAKAHSMIKSGKFPKENIDEKNPAIRKWSEEAKVPPPVFVDELNGVFDNH